VFICPHERQQKLDEVAKNAGLKRIELFESPIQDVALVHHDNAMSCKKNVFENGYAFFDKRYG
jgi:hypothetical protein